MRADMITKSSPAKEGSALQEMSKESENSEKKKKSSRKVFQSLLNALQGDGDGADQQVLTIGSKEGKSDKKLEGTVLGGKISAGESDTDAESEEAVLLEGISQQVTGQSVSAEAGKVAKSGESAEAAEKKIASDSDAKKVAKNSEDPTKGEGKNQALKMVASSEEGDGDSQKSSEQTEQSNGKEVTGKNNDAKANGKFFGEGKSKNLDGGKLLKRHTAGKATVEKEVKASGNGVQEQAKRSEATDKQKQLIANLFQKSGAKGITEKGWEVKSLQAEKMLKKETTKGNKSQENSKSLLSGVSGRLGFMHLEGNNSSPLNLGDITNFNITTANSDFSVDQQNVMWEQQSAESAETADENEAQQSNSSSTMKLGQLPVSNMSLRKNILSGLTKSTLKAASEAKKNPGQWQKHTFTLDDGKNIQLSVRESKGVLQVKLGSMNLDLSKLLQQNIQQIREHLKQEFGTEIDLQFQNNEQENSSEFAENSTSFSNKKKNKSSFSTNAGGPQQDNTGPANSNIVRRFGYNQMEWTA